MDIPGLLIDQKMQALERTFDRFIAITTGTAEAVNPEHSKSASTIIDQKACMSSRFLQNNP